MGKSRPHIKKQYMEVLRPCLHFHGIQIKSEYIFRRFADAVDTIEEITGIHSCNISLEDIFVCPDIDLDAIQDPTPMENILIGMIKTLSCKGRDR